MLHHLLTYTKTAFTVTLLGITGFLTPGLSLVLVNLHRRALVMQFLLYTVFAILAWFRLLEYKSALIFICLIIVLAYIYGVITSIHVYFKNKQQNNKEKWYWGRSICFCIFFWGIFIAAFYGKQYWTGYDIYFIPTKSMIPVLNPGDYILVDTWSYHSSAPKNGDIALFISPEHKNRTLIKRILAIPGDTVVNNGYKPYIISSINTSSIASAMHINLKSELYFVLGDNLFHSRDSRFFGPISIDAIIGSAKVILYSNPKSNNTLGTKLFFELVNERTKADSNLHFNHLQYQR